MTIPPIRSRLGKAWQWIAASRKKKAALLCGVILIAVSIAAVTYLKLYPKIMEALKEGGNFVLQLFSIDHPQTNRFGPRSPSMLVKPNELLTRFGTHRVRYYDDRVVNLDEGMHQGSAAVVRLVVEKSGR